MEEKRHEPALQIGDFRVEPAVLHVRGDGGVKRLEPQVMRLLVFLADRSPDVVSRAEILEHIWEGRAVVDETVTRAISLLRQAFGDSARTPRYIETIPRRGYRLVADVRRIEAEGSAGPVPGVVAGPPPTQASREKGQPPPAAGSVPGVAKILGLGAAALALVLAVVLAVLLWPAQDSPSAAVDGQEIFRSAEPPRLAVLAFDNLTGDPGDAFLAAGMTEELTHQLSALSALRVVSRTSATSELIRSEDLGRIAKRLRADYVLEGSVLAVNDQLRITAQLIDPRRDEHLWSKSYDGPMDRVLDLQREVSLDVAERVSARLTSSERRRLERRESVEASAYGHYLAGRHRLSLRTSADVASAMESLQTALEIDPDFAPAWATLAAAHLLSDPYLKVPQTEAYASAQAAIDRALALDGELAAAHVSLGLLRLFRDWDWRGSEAAYREAIRLEPSHARAHQWLSETLSLAGRHEEALEAVVRAVDLDPLSPLVYAAWGQRLNAAGRHREALERIAQADALGATFNWHRREIAYARERLGQPDAAARAWLEHASRSWRGKDDVAALENAIAQEGLTGYWRWQLPKLLKPPTAEPALIAEAYAGLGRIEDALPWLETAVRKRGSWFLHLQKSPAFDVLRGDPRFQALIDEATPSSP
ncbi:MAG: winged helix-turn-helix domain-containing protein [Acidobacteriota bacterium]